MSVKPTPIDRLRAAGKRVTPERQLLVRILDRHPHLDATALHRMAQKEQPRIGLATVYRTLGLLERLGVIRACRLGEGHAHYELRRDDHLHLVCAECGRIIDLPSPMPLRELAASQGFHVDRSRLELIGMCRDCAATKRSRGRRKATRQ